MIVISVSVEKMKYGKSKVNHSCKGCEFDRMSYDYGFFHGEMNQVNLPERDLPGEFSETGVNSIDDSASLSFNSALCDSQVRTKLSDVH